MLNVPVNRTPQRNTHLTASLLDSNLEDTSLPFGDLKSLALSYRNDKSDKAIPKLTGNHRDHVNRVWSSRRACWPGVDSENPVLRAEDLTHSRCDKELRNDSSECEVVLMGLGPLKSKSEKLNRIKLQPCSL